jgi:DNA-3-methyladenine glycosylase I
VTAPYPDDGLVKGSDGKQRCFWCMAAPEYVRYHDEEWGVKTRDEQYLFEKLCLEGFQAGLSWLTILRKRPAFRRAFANFDITAVARFGEKEVDTLLANPGIVRHRGKIESAINNARKAQELIGEAGSLREFIWRFEPAPASRPARFDWATLRQITTTAESMAMSKELKRRGWTFVGPTTLYAFMQAVGVVNDHFEGCWKR